MDFDLRRPDVARLSGVTARAGLASLLTSDVELEQLMIGSPHTPGLRILPAVESDGVLLESLMRGLPDILARGRLLADYVVVDTAPVGEVSDALGVVEQVDDVLLVVRPGHTDRHSLEYTRDLLERSDARPTGIVLTGQMLQGSRSYTYGGEPVGRAASEASPARLARR
jgi:Mrp family chromosome partitioning ATPase